jgi:hypothetical protein
MGLIHGQILPALKSLMGVPIDHRKVLNHNGGHEMQRLKGPGAAVETAARRGWRGCENAAKSERQEGGASKIHPTTYYGQEADWAVAQSW